MATLHMDVIANEILPKLPAKSLLRFKCVCKSFNALISSPTFIDLHLRLSTSNPNIDRILFLPGTKCNIFSVDLESPQYPVSEYSFHQTLNCNKVSPTFGIGSCNGLLCFTILDGRSERLILFNPCTRNYREIPPAFKQCSKVGWCRGIGFGFNDMKKEYKVVRLEQHTEAYGAITSMYSMVYSLNTNSWRRSPMPLKNFCNTYSGVVVSYRFVHWLYLTNSQLQLQVSCFDLRSEGWSDDVPLPNYYDREYVGRYVTGGLGVLNGCLCWFVKNTSAATYDVWIMNEYGVRDSWVKLLSTSYYPPAFVDPVAYNRGSSHQILLMQRQYGHKSQLFWYDIEQQESRSPSDLEDQNLNCYRGCVCKESLVTIPGGCIIEEGKTRMTRKNACISLSRKGMANKKHHDQH